MSVTGYGQFYLQCLQVLRLKCFPFILAFITNLIFKKEFLLLSG